jgi:hypothetical protein
LKKIKTLKKDFAALHMQGGFFCGRCRGVTPDTGFRRA